MQENPINYFQELKVFEDNNVNILCDELSSLVKNFYGEELLVCGSLSKIFLGSLPDTYTPKDIDFIVNPIAFQRLYNRLEKLNSVTMVEKQPHRIILYTKHFICIEIWKERESDKQRKKIYYKNLIPFLCPEV